MSFSKFTITVHAGPHDRLHCPLRVRIPERLPDALWGICTDDGQALWLQRTRGDEYALIEPGLRAEQSRAYLFHPQTVGPDGTPSLVFRHDKDSHIALTEQDAPVTRYVYGHVPARPYFYPLKAPNGVEVTRAFPMNVNVIGETHDHPHHRSLWIAFGDVNGADNWSEEPGHAFTLHRSVDALTSGNVAARFATMSEWTRADQTPLLTQFLEVTAWASTAQTRLLDFHIRLIATHGDVDFGDTKEGGVLSTRVASAMDVNRGGRIVNSYGGIDEAEAWGRAAHWCDYSGIVDGRRVGIAILDHPLSFRYPTHWHVRNYGLMTANPFGYSAYTNGEKDGSYRLPAGETLSFHYRVVLHTGDAQEGEVNAHYLNYVAPPRVEISSAG